jgi:hypothetical protein
MSPILVSPLKKCLELLGLTRILTLFNPTIWGDGDGFDFWRRFLHTTIIGGWFVSVFWWALERDIVQLNGWDKDTQIKKLKPWTPAFWLGPSTSILNYPTDFYQHIRNGTVKVISLLVKHFRLTLCIVQQDGNTSRRSRSRPHPLLRSLVFPLISTNLELNSLREPI